MYSVIIVSSTSQAIRAEKALKNADLEAKLIPVPRSLSSDCGVAIRIVSECEEKCLNILTESKSPFEKIVPLEQ